MLVTYSDNIALNVTPDEVWRLLRDTQRLAGLVPGVESVARVENVEPETYAATVSEKVGPFKVSLNLEIEIVEIVEHSLLRAVIKGADKMKLSRATGSVAVSLMLEQERTVARLQIEVEVLGKLATLGATVIRRRVNELFNQFSARFQAEFEAASA